LLTFYVAVYAGIDGYAMQFVLNFVSFFTILKDLHFKMKITLQSVCCDMHQMSQRNISAASLYKERSHSVELSGCLEKAIAKSVIFLLPANSREPL
jgi:hypothetical protein